MANSSTEHSHLLIIDEQPLAQSYMRQSLERAGYRSITVADSARQAKLLCAEESFDLILCAFELNKHQDGYQLYEELQVKGLIKSGTGFIFTSAETSGELVHSILELQPDDFLVKPFNSHTLKSRIERVLERKHALKHIYQLIDDQNYTKALRHIDEALNQKHALAAILLRLKGSILLTTKQFSDAIVFYKTVIDVQGFSWAHVGLVEALIGNKEHTKAHQLLTQMLNRSDTKLAALNLLSDIEIQLNHFEKAQQYLQAATDIAPRNIERQKELSEVATLNHDYEMCYHARSLIAKYAKHSVHDSPQVYLNAARASIDYALTTDQGDQINRVSRQTSKYISELKSQFPQLESQDQAQIDVLNARLHYLKDEHQKAKHLIAQLVDDDAPIRSIDGALDQAKAYHELGLNEQANSLFNKIIEHCKSYPHISNDVQMRSIMQQQAERAKLKMGPRELNNHAVETFNRGHYPLALEAFTQSFSVMPKNTNIALNLLQCLAEGAAKQGMSYNSALAKRCITVLDNSELNAPMSERFEKVKDMLSLQSA